MKNLARDETSSTRLNSVSQNSGPFLLSSFCTIGFQTDAGLQATAALAIHAVFAGSRRPNRRARLPPRLPPITVIRSLKDKPWRSTLIWSSSFTKATTNSSMKSSTGVPIGPESVT